MPLYDFECIVGHRFEKMVPLAEFYHAVFCECKEIAIRQISAPMFTIDNTGYNCPVTNKWIGSKQSHSENLKAQDCRVLEPGESESNAHYRAKSDSDLESAIDKTVETTIDSMPSEKKEKLYAELTRGGADVEYSRGIK